MPYSNSQIATTGKVIEIGVKKQQEPPPTWRIIANLALASKKSQPRAAPTQTRDTCKPRTTVSNGQRRVRTFASQGTTRKQRQKAPRTARTKRITMPDRMTPQQRHNCMSHIHSRDTRPELAARRELWRRGFRYRVNVRKLPGTPDIVLPKYRTAIFVNGCFWHGHKGCHSYTVPKTNTGFWQDKVARNRARDLTNAQRLESIGWSVMTVWECELGKSRLRETMDRVEATLQINKDKWAGAVRDRNPGEHQKNLEKRRSRCLRSRLEYNLYICL